MLDAVRFGFDLYKAIKNSSEYKNAVRASLLREIRYNEEILNELIKNEVKFDRFQSKRSGFNLLRTEVFDNLHLNFVSIKDVLEEKKLSPKTLEKIKNHSNGNFRKWLQNTKTNVELLEKAYHRISVLKALESIDKYKTLKSKKYLKFLLLLLREGL